MYKISILSFVCIIIALTLINISKEQPWFSSFNALELVSKYSPDEINHFSLFAFSSGRILKWRKNININLNNILYADSTVYVSINNCVDQLNGLIEEIQIFIDSKDFNVTVFIKDSIDAGVVGRAPTYVSGFKIPYPTINKGSIQLVVKNREPEAINSTIFHEFSHLLGFHHNLEKFKESDWTYKSLFNPPTKTFNDLIDDFEEDFIEYSDLDKAAIRIMYDKEIAIDPGLTKDKFLRMIEEAKKEMVQ